MLSKFTDWLEFHIEVLERKKFPFFIWLFGAFMACIGIFVYENLVTRLYNSIFNKLIVDNIDMLRHGLWIVPLVIFLIFWEVGVAQIRLFLKKKSYLVSNIVGY